jgi:hypothetical protein
MGRRNKVSSLAVIGDEEGEEDKKKKTHREGKQETMVNKTQICKVKGVSRLDRQCRRAGKPMMTS